MGKCQFVTNPDPINSLLISFLLQKLSSKAQVEDSLNDSDYVRRTVIQHSPPSIKRAQTSPTSRLSVHKKFLDDCSHFSFPFPLPGPPRPNNRYSKFTHGESFQLFRKQALGKVPGQPFLSRLLDAEKTAAETRRHRSTAADLDRHLCSPVRPSTAQPVYSKVETHDPSCLSSACFGSPALSLGWRPHGRRYESALWPGEGVV